MEQTSDSTANYNFGDPTGPYATITGPEEVTIITGYDAENQPLYDDVVPHLITLRASGNISRDTISNVDVLDVVNGEAIFPHHPVRR